MQGAPLPQHEILQSPSCIESLRAATREQAKTELVAVEGQAFAKAVRVTSLEKMEHFWMHQISFGTGREIRKGDVFLLRFYARGSSEFNEHGEADIQAYFQKNSGNYKKVLSVRLSVGRAWKQFNYPFLSNQHLAAADNALCFGFGFNKQMAEIGGIELLRFPKGTPLNSLPRTKITYYGSAPDAPWRAEAAARIEKYRKEDLAIEVVDGAGNPVADADVAVEMQRHAFGFSSVFAVPMMVADTEDGRIYRRKLRELFNASGPENGLKWPCWEQGWGKRTPENTLSVLKQLKEDGFHLRGHVMVWPAWRHLPPSVRKLKGTERQKQIPEMVRKHIRNIGRATAGYTDEWDVINEPRANHDLMDIFGREIMVDWFKEADKALPNAKLYINDYSILNGAGAGSPAHDIYKQNIAFLLEKGAPIDGIGFQSHMGGNLNDPAKVYRILEDFAPFDLDMRITEFDIKIHDEETQADYTRDFMTIVFSHPRVVGFQNWGFWEGAHWIPMGAMYRRDWSEKPNAKAYKKLVFQDWWTRERGKADNDGKFACRAFLGDYKITVAKNGKTVSRKVKLEKGRGGVRIQLP